MGSAYTKVLWWDKAHLRNREKAREAGAQRERGRREGRQQRWAGGSPAHGDLAEHRNAFGSLNQRAKGSHQVALSEGMCLYGRHAISASHPYALALPYISGYTGQTFSSKCQNLCFLPEDMF